MRKIGERYVPHGTASSHETSPLQHLQLSNVRVPVNDRAVPHVPVSQLDDVLEESDTDPEVAASLFHSENVQLISLPCASTPPQRNVQRTLQKLTL